MRTKWGKIQKEEKTEKRENFIRDSGIHAYVATPAYNGKVDTDYAIALAESCQMATINGIKVTAAVMGNGAFIDLARCTFAAMFLKTDCTHLFFIDADLRWEPRAFVGLLTSGRPIVAGAYRKREEPESYPLRFIEENNGIQPVDGGWIKCDRVATGFLCIERRVIEEMAKDVRWIKQTGEFFSEVPRLFYTDIIDDDRFIGEDFAFCDLYTKKYGEPIHVWPDMDFTHGGYACNWHNFLNGMAEEAETLEAEGVISIDTNQLQRVTA